MFARNATTERDRNSIEAIDALE